MKDLTLQEQLKEEFQWFHSHPELSYEEFETTKKIKELLIKEGIHILDTPLKTGLIAEIKGEKEGPVIALRCDIDALPISENTDLPYCSVNKGKMHACGHDFHLVTILGAARCLKKRVSLLKGTVKLLFQPAEESSLGAVQVVESGELKDVTAIFGIHTSSYFPVGTLGIRTGSVTAAVDRFKITLKGKGCHAAHPDEGNDPMVMAASFILSAQTIVSRNLNPFHSGLVSITHIEGGSTWNVIPQEVMLEGTVRTLDKKDRKLIEDRIRSMAEHTAKSYGGVAQVEWIAGPPATDNHPFWSKVAVDTAEKQGLLTEPSYESLGGEDFAFYQELIEGVFIQIGTGETYPSHHPKFQVDMNALAPAAEYMAQLAEDALNILSERS